MNMNHLTSVSAVGYATVSRTPDLLTLALVIQEEAAEKAEAVAKVNEITLELSKVLDALPSAHYKTVRYHEYPYMSFFDETDETETTYRVFHTLSVRLEDLSELEGLLEAVSNPAYEHMLTISSVAFGVKDHEGMVREARKKAIGHAIATVEDYSEALGRKVSRIDSVSDPEFGTNPNRGRNGMFYAASTRHSVHPQPVLVPPEFIEVNAAINLTASAELPSKPDTASLLKHRH